MERVLGLYLAFDARVISNYLENPDTAMENLQEVQPTMLGTDPQLWQLLHARVTQRRRRRHALATQLYRGAIAAGRVAAHGVLARSACCERCGANSG